MPKIELCSTGDVAPGTAMKVETEGLVLAVFNLEGTFYVTDDACTHGPGSLSEGYIDGDVSSAISIRASSTSARARWSRRLA